MNSLLLRVSGLVYGALLFGACSSSGVPSALDTSGGSAGARPVAGSGSVDVADPSAAGAKDGATGDGGASGATTANGSETSGDAGASGIAGALSDAGAPSESAGHASGGAPSSAAAGGAGAGNVAGISGDPNDGLMIPCDVDRTFSVCRNCHRDPPNSGAPFPLLTLSDVRANKNQAINDVFAGVMPLGATLPAAEKTLMLDWLNAGAHGVPQASCP